MDYDVYLYILVELVVTILTSPRSSKTESGCERYARFRFALSAVLQWGGSSGPEAGTSGDLAKHRKFRPIFPSEHFWLSPFGDSLWRGSGILPRKFPGVRNIRSRKILVKSFCDFLSGGGREIRPESFLGNFRGPEYPVLNPGISALPWLQWSDFGGGYK